MIHEALLKTLEGHQRQILGTLTGTLRQEDAKTGNVFVARGGDRE